MYPNSNAYLHIFKDFGLSGIRCGVMHTLNKEIIKLSGSNSYFGATAAVVQYQLQRLISDTGT